MRMIKASVFLKMEEQMLVTDFVALIALDWADKKHAGKLLDVKTGLKEDFELKQRADAIQEWVGVLRKRFKGGKIAVALEQKRGALIYGLMKYELFVIFPLNTTAVCNYRKALRASGAKDDISDADLQLEFLSAHIHRLKSWKPDSEKTRQLTFLTENRRKLVNKASAVSNQIQALLKEYYPTALEMLDRLKSPLACDFLRRWPTLEALRRANKEQLQKFYYKRNSRSKQLIEQRFAAVQSATALVDEKAICKAYRLTLIALVREMKSLLESIAEFDKEIESVFQLHDDRMIYESLPAVGPVLGPRLAAAFGEDHSKFDSTQAIQNFSGIAPITKSSGKSKAVLFRFGAPKFFRQTFVEFAGLSITSSLWARAYYRFCRNKGKEHHAAVRALAYKWIRILYRCWENHETYNEQKYLDTLKRRNSPLISLIGIK
jgi:transposase